MLTLIALFSADAAEAALAGGNSSPEVANPQRIELGLEKQVRVELRDYRDPPDDATFDKVSSIGMLERVRLKNLPTYSRVVRRVLKPGGLSLNHGITDNERGRYKTFGTEFCHLIE